MKAFSLFILIFTSLVAYSQDGYIEAGSDTLKGADTVYHRTELLKQASGFVQFQVDYDLVSSGTPTGYSVLQASTNGKKWATLNTTDLTVYTSGNDTMNYNTLNVNLWGLSGLPFNYFRSMNINAAGDTLVINSNYGTKKY